LPFFELFHRPLRARGPLHLLLLFLDSARHGRGLLSSFKFL
jgi:hypothetical protein